MELVTTFTSAGKVLFILVSGGGGGCPCLLLPKMKPLDVELKGQTLLYTHPSISYGPTV